MSGLQIQFLMAAFSVHSPGLMVGLFEALCVALVASFLGFCCARSLCTTWRRGSPGWAGRRATRPPG